MSIAAHFLVYLSWRKAGPISSLVFYKVISSHLFPSFQRNYYMLDNSQVKKIYLKRFWFIETNPFCYRPFESTTFSHSFPSVPNCSGMAIPKPVHVRQKKKWLEWNQMRQVQSGKSSPDCARQTTRFSICFQKQCCLAQSGHGHPPWRFLNIVNPARFNLPFTS